MIAALLCTMAVVDGALAGFRAWAGRDGRVVKRRERVRAGGLGAAAAIAALAVIGLAAAVAMLATDADYGELVAAGTRMAAVYLPFCGAVLLGFLGYFVAGTDVQALSTVLVLGPATLIRPVVILAGALAAGWGQRPAVAIVALSAVAAMLAIEPALGRYWARALGNHPFTSRGSADSIADLS